MVGNDVVDLGDPETRPGATHPRFDARVFGDRAPRLANTSCLAMPGVRAETQVMALDLAGVAVSAGAACSSGKIAPSHVLRAMGADEALADGAIRVSLGWASEPGDVDRFVAAWTRLYASTRPGGRPGRGDKPLAKAGPAGYQTDAP